MIPEYIINHQEYNLRVYEDEIYNQCIFTLNLFDQYIDATTPGVEHMYPGLEGTAGNITTKIKQVVMNMIQFVKKYYHKFMDWIGSKTRIIKQKFGKAEKERTEKYNYTSDDPTKKSNWQYHGNQQAQNNSNNNQQQLPQSQQSQQQNNQQQQQIENQQTQQDESWKQVKVLTLESYQKVGPMVNELLVICKKTIFVTHGNGSTDVVKQNIYACKTINENIEDIINNDQTHMEWGTIVQKGQEQEYFNYAKKVSESIQLLEKKLNDCLRYNEKMLAICNNSIQDIQTGKEEGSKIQMWQMLLQHISQCTKYFNKVRLFISTTEQIADLYMAHK